MNRTTWRIVAAGTTLALTPALALTGLRAGARHGR
jgi:hypothetical protein